MVKGADPRNPGNWQDLESVAGSGTAKGDNITRVVFDYNLTIIQKSKTASCTIKWTSSELGDSQVHDCANSEAPIVAEIDIHPRSKGSISFDGDIEFAQQLPLAKRRDSIARLRLSVLHKKFKQAGGGAVQPPKILISHIKALLSGVDEHDLDDRWERLVQTDRNILDIESNAQKEMRKLAMHDIPRTRATGQGRPSFIIHAQGSSSGQEVGVSRLSTDVSGSSLATDSSLSGGKGKGNEIAAPLSRIQALKERERDIRKDIEDLKQECTDVSVYYGGLWLTEIMRARRAELGAPREELSSIEMENIVQEQGRKVRCIRQENKKLREAFETELTEAMTDLAHEMVVERAKAAGQ
ncbi:MAG: hypothetical protein Q9169_003716 [Polycauliona sp. 2 TL-2023]